LTFLIKSVRLYLLVGYLINFLLWGVVMLKDVYKVILDKLGAKDVIFNKIPKINENRLSTGNSKLDKSILIFDLTAGKLGSCDRNCPKCYAIKAQVQYSYTKLYRAINFELAKNYSDYLERLITIQINKTKSCKTVRIHSSGDFFSQEYIDMWNRIIKDFPTIKFYAYTKRIEQFDFTEICENSNFNMIDSFIEIDGKKYINYGTNKYVAFLVENGAFLCPATHKKWKGLCGKDCNYCMTQNKVCFHIH